MSIVAPSGHPAAMTGNHTCVMAVEMAKWPINNLISTESMEQEIVALKKMNYLKNGGYYLLTRPINLGGKYEDRLPSDNTRPVAGGSMDVKLINQFL